MPAGLPDWWDTLPVEQRGQLHPAVDVCRQIQPGAVASIDRATAMAAHGAPRCCRHHRRVQATWWVCAHHQQIGLLCHPCLRRHGDRDHTDDLPCDGCGRLVDSVAVDLVFHLPRPTRIRPPRSAVERNRADLVLLSGVGLCPPCAEQLATPPD